MDELIVRLKRPVLPFSGIRPKYILSSELRRVLYISRRCLVSAALLFLYVSFLDMPHRSEMAARAAVLFLCFVPSGMLEFFLDREKRRGNEVSECSGVATIYSPDQSNWLFAMNLATAVFVSQR